MIRYKRKPISAPVRIVNPERMVCSFSGRRFFVWVIRFSLQPLGEARTDRICLSSSDSSRIVGWYKRYSKDSYLNIQYSNCTCYVELCVTYSITYFTTSEFVMTNSCKLNDAWWCLQWLSYSDIYSLSQASDGVVMATEKKQKSVLYDDSSVNKVVHTGVILEYPVTLIYSFVIYQYIQ